MGAARRWVCGVPLTAVLVVAALGCGGEAAREGAKEAPDSAALAGAQFDATAFDTIQWKDRSAALERGGVVWRFSCAKCHGMDGRGGGEVAIALKLEVPSIVGAEWRLARDVEGLRRKIFVGTNAGMPNWGLHGLRYRDIDAVATYMIHGLRPGPGTGAATRRR